MSQLGPIKRKELIRRLKALGFEGPYGGARHDVMRRSADQAKVPIPRDDAKSREIGVPLQKRILLEIGVSTQEWVSV